ncbi:MAG: hypothetical protein AB7F86_04265 [Bdellovibrionales bacterium]
MRLVGILLLGLMSAFTSYAEEGGAQPHHSMQHGFILAEDGSFASHLVANGHHSWQTEVVGQLSIDDPQEKQVYDQKRALSRDGHSYFHLQAQNVDLSQVKAGQILSGPIVESASGNYEPKNIIVRSATFRVDKVLLNLPNPFFGDL